MVSVLHKKLLRALWRARGQSVGVVAVVACGTACYISIASAHSNLVLTRDTYYAQNRFADFEIVLERAPDTALFKLRSIPGVHQVRGRIVKDANLDIEGSDDPVVGRVISMPNTKQPVLNDVHLVSGRYFSEGAQDEVILSERFARENKIAIGDRIHASIESRKYPLRVVGLGLSPEYVYMIRNVAELVPSPERFAILWVSEDFAETALNSQNACNNVVGSVDSHADVDFVLDRAEDILDAYGVIAKVRKDQQLSNQFVSEEIKGLAVTAKVVPGIFQGIAAMILLVLLNRMVRSERAEIGLLKAYGYSNWSIAWHYIQYALVLAVAGSLIGFGAGQWLANGMIKLYVKFYDFPILRSRVYPDVLARSIGISIMFSVLGAVIAAARAARIHPAESMRPEAPRFGHHTALERLPGFWRALSFTSKMIVRNVSRNAFRAAFLIFGVMISTGLLFIGFFSSDAMRYMLAFQFSAVQREDLTINLVTERGTDALHEIARLDGVRFVEPMLQYPFEIASGWRQKDIALVGLPKAARLQKLIDENEDFFDVGDHGLVVSRRLADDLRVDVGSVVSLKSLTGRVTKTRQAVVVKVVKQYLGSSAYMNIDALSRMLDEPFAMNAALVRTEPGAARAINRHLKDVPIVAAVSIKEDAYKSLWNTLAQNMIVMNTMLIGFSAIIACAVIYNVTAVSLAERARELASLRVLGFTQAEVGGILYRENFVLATVGLFLGIPAGVGLCRLLVIAYDTELFRMPFHIERITYVYVMVLIVSFVVAANLAVHAKIKRLDLVEVLKERE